MRHSECSLSLAAQLVPEGFRFEPLVDDVDQAAGGALVGAGQRRRRVESEGLLVGCRA